MFGVLADTVLLATLLTLLATTIEVVHRSRRQRASDDNPPSTRLRLRACLTGHLFLYWAIMVPLNSGFALIAALGLPAWSPEVADELGGWAAVLYAIVGVLLFEGLLANTNVAVFDKGVLVFQYWMAIARAPAVEAVIEKQAAKDRDYQQKAVEQLNELLSEEELDTRLAELLDEDEARRLQEDASADSRPKLYKLLWFARQYPGEARSIVKNKSR